MTASSLHLAGSRGGIDKVLAAHEVHPLTQRAAPSRLLRACYLTATLFSLFPLLSGDVFPAPTSQRLARVNLRTGRIFVVLDFVIHQ